MNDYGDYINGHVERTAKGEYTGRLSVEGIDLSPIQAQYFKKDGDIYCFIKRRPIMEYSIEQGKYITRERKPKASRHGWRCGIQRRVYVYALPF